MKTLVTFLGASLMVISSLSAAPAVARPNCPCQSCTCTKEKNCGCFSKTGRKCASQTCQCGQNCQCGDTCYCGSKCSGQTS